LTDLDVASDCNDTLAVSVGMNEPSATTPFDLSASTQVGDTFGKARIKFLEGEVRTETCDTVCLRLGGGWRSSLTI